MYLILSRSKDPMQQQGYQHMGLVELYLVIYSLWRFHTLQWGLASLIPRPSHSSICRLQYSTLQSLATRNWWGKTTIWQLIQGFLHKTIRFIYNCIVVLCNSLACCKIFCKRLYSTASVQQIAKNNLATSKWIAQNVYVSRPDPSSRVGSGHARLTVECAPITRNYTTVKHLNWHHLPWNYFCIGFFSGVQLHSTMTCSLTSRSHS